ncbi:LacI family DNA-binding transcriptional regulator [uncultured Serinicoccus sp.]|uniref:LacI family DNA-binding transcriptional regulator n=1 Tax=uncultured Serinicoccus sp. TaxID=735514 RepID=UPI00262E12A2|nr:LacI family DNA-binding transcriptional regulator [uncultured Serinicoccus sp.]
MAGFRKVPAPTLESVAARAGVSRATAGRILSGKAGRGENSKAVHEAAAELGYVANYAARSLMTRRSDAVAFVVSEPEESVFLDPFFATVLRGVHEGVAARERQLTFIIVSSEHDRHRLQQFIVGGHLDGLMFGAFHGADSLPDAVRALGIPVVQCGRPHEADDDLAFVDADNVGGGRAAAGYLLDRRAFVVHVAGPADMTPAQDRRAGFDLELAGRGLTATQDRTVHAPFTVQGGREATEVLLDRHPQLDGVVAASDAMAVGAIQALTARGRRVPEDVGVVGFDDVPLAEAAQPPLTTVRQPIRQMGREVADLLLDQIDGRSGPRHVLLPTTLRVRGSA